MRRLLVVRSRRLLAHLSLTVIRSGDGGATAGGGAAAAPRGRRQRRPGGRGGSGTGASPWWMPHPERCPPSREPRPPPQGGGGSNLLRGDPSLFPRLSAQQGIRGGPVEREKDRGLQRLTGELLLRPLGWSAAGSGQEGAGRRRTWEQRRRFPQGCGEEEAELHLVGAGGGVPSPGSGQRRRGPAGAHPTISRLAAGCPSTPGDAWVGPQARAEPGKRPRGGGFLQTRSSRDSS
ncbi:uncharacterized protein LOC128928780 [Callithrix jacchus]|uniref:translation initiation factor IF-2-like n=1 Tax=Callithrix jacchus TaxID=9483 RepID=UPI0023DD2B6F|nr:translation initiation factor IF-2-like [Callithrix jacchus]